MSDEELLADFVIWRLRYRDLPSDVAQAAERLAATGNYPRATRRSGYLDSTFVVVGVDQGEHEPPRARCFGIDDSVARAADLLAEGVPYVLIQRL